MDMEVARLALTEAVEKHDDLKHVQVRKRGSALLLVSGNGPGAQKHARMVHLGGRVWARGFPHHSGRWEKSPFSGSPEELLETLVENFPFYLEQY